MGSGEIPSYVSPASNAFYCLHFLLIPFIAASAGQMFYNRVEFYEAGISPY